MMLDVFVCFSGLLVFPLMNLGPFTVFVPINRGFRGLSVRITPNERIDQLVETFLFTTLFYDHLSFMWKEICELKSRM